MILKLLLTLDLWLGAIDFSNVKRKKIDEELMPIGWYPTREWDWL